MLGDGFAFAGGLGLGHVDAQAGRDAQRAGGVQGVLGHHRLVELQALALVLCAESQARGGFAVVAEDHEILQHQADVGVLLDQLDNLGRGVTAVAAAIVEELGDGDRAVRIDDDVTRVALDGLAVMPDGLLGRGGLLGGLLFLQFLAGLHQHLGVLQQIGANLLAEPVAGLGGGALATGEGEAGDGQRNGEGRGATKQGHGDLERGVGASFGRRCPWPGP